jgi:hypothetical protein
MQKEFFDSLPDEKLGHACFEPMIPIYQNGMRKQSGQDAQGFRAEFYKSLPQGQRALLGFFTFYDHAIRSKDEFQQITTLYLSGRFFAIVKKGAEYFGAANMQNLLLDTEEALSKQSGEQNSRVDELYDRLREITPHTLIQIGAFIKENPAEFVSF